jgi:glycosyltransferase involved in cell wall biosynthesis
VAHVHNTLALVTPSVYYACQDEGVPVVQTLYNYRLICPVGSLLREGRICEECINHSLWRSVRYGCYRNSRVQTAAVAGMLYRHRRRATWSQMIDAYLVPTEFMRRKLIEGGLPAVKIVVKPNFHEPDPGLRETSDDSALYVGRLTEEKGLRILVAAWKRMEHPPRLRIIGDGPLREELEQVAGMSQGCIEILGQRSHAEAMEYLKKAAFVVLPSAWYEGFPHVILEAYACGVPILASRLGTLADVIEDGVTGLLFEPGQSADLAAKVLWMVGHETAARQIGLNGRRTYETLYRAEQNYQRLQAIYQGVIETGLAGIRSGVPGEAQPNYTACDGSAERAATPAGHP